MWMEKNFWKLVAPCCNYGHKTMTIYVSSNKTLNKIVNNVAIKMYGSALQRKYKSVLSSYKSRLIPSVKSKSYLLIEVFSITVPSMLPSIQTHTALQTSRQHLRVVRHLV